MNKLFIALVFIVLSVAYCESTTSQIALLDCDGNFFAYPMKDSESAVAMNLENYFSMLSLMMDRYVDRFSCVCPNAKKADILRIYNPVFGWTLPGMWDNIFSPIIEEKIPGCQFGGAYNEIYSPIFKLPYTCNYKESGQCLAYYELAKGITFQVAIAECPNSNLPFISVNCNGTGCDSLGLPCVNDDECSGPLTCNPYMYRGEPFPGDNPATRDLMNTIMLSNPEEKDKCYDPMGTAEKLGNHIRTVMYKRKPTSFKSIKYCSPGVYHAETMEQDLNRTTNIFCPMHTMPGPSGRLNMDCVVNNGPLKPWNGITNEGMNILKWKTQHPFEIPSNTAKPRTPGAVVILDIDCDESYKIFPGSKFGTAVQTRHVLDLFNIAYDTYRKRLDCESSIYGFSLDDTKFAANYFLPSFFAAYTGNQETWNSNFISQVQTWAGYNFGQNDLFQKMVFPKTCDYNSWKNKGKCELTYDGLSSLFGIDITFNVAVSKCDYREYPNVYVECVGHDCNMFEGLVSCDPNDYKTCPNAECINAKDLIQEISVVSQRGETYDFISQALGFITPQCPVTNTTLLENDINSIMKYFNVKGDHVCFPSLERLQQTGSAWAQTQYYNSNGAIVLTNVGPWESPSN